MAGILAIWNDCAPEALDHYERWYCGEHLAERVGVPGFRFGRRYEALRADRRYFTYYEVDDPSVLASPPYLERLNNPTEWTREAMASFRGMMRTVCDVTHSAGDLHGAFAVTLRLAHASSVSREMRAMAGRLSSEIGVARVQIWTASACQTPGGTREMSSRAEPDEAVPAAIVVECLRLADAERAAARLSQDAVAGLRAEGRPDIGIYALLCSLDRANLR